MDDQEFIMTNQKLKEHFFLELVEIYPENEIQSLFHILIEHRLKLSRVQFALNYHAALNEEDIDYFQKCIIELIDHRPIQYIVGTTDFFGLKFAVDPSVLIPRPETEELVAWVIEDLKEDLRHSKNKKIKILDIGTGSGCIAVSLAKNLPNTEVYALDIAPEAIAVARSNARLNNCKINFNELDILTTEKLPHKFDIIVSNPPYVREQEKDQMQANVTKNEPHLALFVKNENPLIFYDKISDLAKIFLKSKGTLYFEINQYLGEQMRGLLKSKGFRDIELRKDIFSFDRMIKSIKE